MKEEGIWFPHPHHHPSLQERRGGSQDRPLEVGADSEAMGMLLPGLLRSICSGMALLSVGCALSY